MDDDFDDKLDISEYDRRKLIVNNVSRRILDTVDDAIDEQEMSLVEILAAMHDATAGVVALLLEKSWEQYKKG